MNKTQHKYEEIFFSFIYRDDVYPAIKKIKGFTLKKVLVACIKRIKYDVQALFKPINTELKEKIWFYAESINQVNALEHLQPRIKDSVFVTTKESLKSKISHIKFHDITIRRNKYRLFNFRKFYQPIFGLKFKDHLATIIQYDGVYESIIKLLEKQRPKAIIFSNDHNVMCRALMVSANELNIKTVYIQHAAVTDKFPPLNFSLNLLEGRDSLEKYRKAGNINGEVKLVGMLKFDSYLKKINKNESIKTIGIALNNGDNVEFYIDFFKKLSKKHSQFTFYIRFHPSMNFCDFPIPDTFKISDSKNEKSFDFLSSIDLLFAGNSSIHLEATLMNVPSYQIEYTTGDVDYYGFIQRKLIHFIQLNDIERILLSKKEQNIRQKAKYYVDTIDTEWDGKSVNLSAEIIEQVILQQH